MCDSFTLQHIFATYCKSFYGCELFNFPKPNNYVKIVYFMAENYTLYFRLSPTTHYYIVSNLGNCIIGRLVRFSLITLVIVLIYFNSNIIFLYIICVLLCKKYVRIKIYTYIYIYSSMGCFDILYFTFRR